MEEYSLWSQLMQQFRKSCSSFDGLWIKRKRLVDTEYMVKALLYLVGGAQKSYHQVLDQLFQAEAFSISASSFCEARTRFPSLVVREIREDICACWDERTSPQLWYGFNLYAVDGSRANLPRGLVKNGFKAPKGAYYPQALVSMLVSLESRMIYDINMSQRMDERAQAMEHLARLGRNDLVVYDRGYFSFSLLNAHVHQGIHATFRVPMGNSFSPIEEFSKGEEKEKFVTVDPGQCTYWKAEQSYKDHAIKPIRLRLIRYRMKDEIYILATTLLDSRIPRSAFIKLYKKRWDIEETYKPLKQTLELEVLHSKNLNGVEQEVEAMTLFWNLNISLVRSAKQKLKKSLNSYQSKQTIGNAYSSYIGAWENCYHATAARCTRP